MSNGWRSCCRRPLLLWLLSLPQLLRLSLALLDAHGQLRMFCLEVRRHVTMPPATIEVRAALAARIYVLQLRSSPRRLDAAALHSPLQDEGPICRRRTGRRQGAGRRRWMLALLWLWLWLWMLLLALLRLLMKLKIA